MLNLDTTLVNDKDLAKGIVIFQIYSSVNTIYYFLFVWFLSVLGMICVCFKNPRHVAIISGHM